MAYLKSELNIIVVAILGDTQVSALGLARSVEQCAVELFVAEQCNSEDASIIREAIRDLREKGSFNFG